MSTALSRILGCAALLTLSSCSLLDDTAPVEDPAPETPEAPPNQDAEADTVGLVPSPLEMQKAVKESGIELELASLITERDLSTAAAGADQAAIRTGMVLADLLLTVGTSEKEALVAQIQAVSQGMTKLQGGADIEATLSDLEGRVESDAVTRDELLKELDELSGAVIPELEFNGQERVVPLIQAGSWLEGANLVAKALKASENKGAAAGLLKAPDVVEYFMRYVEVEGSDRAPEAVTQMLGTSLGSLKEIAGKAEALTDEDLDTVAKVTDEVLALL